MRVTAEFISGRTAIDLFENHGGSTARGKGHVNAGVQGPTQRKWDENPSKSNQLSHVQPHPLQRCIGDWIG